MPFTIGGEWIPSSSSASKGPQKPVKVRIVKRQNNLLTVISNLPFPPSRLKELASQIKRSLGCGGALKGDEIEVQGNHVEEVKKILDSLSISHM